MDTSDRSPAGPVAVLARCPVTGQVIDTGARWPGEMDGGLAYTLISDGIGIKACPDCGGEHGWAGEDLLAVLAFAESDGLTNRP